MWQRLLPPLAGEGRDGGQQASSNVTHQPGLYLYGDRTDLATQRGRDVVGN